MISMPAEKKGLRSVTFPPSQGGVGIAELSLGSVRALTPEKYRGEAFTLRLCAISSRREVIWRLRKYLSRLPREKELRELRRSLRPTRLVLRQQQLSSRPVCRRKR